jgi:hypothetical protein
MPKQLAAQNNWYNHERADSHAPGLLNVCETETAQWAR